MSHEQSETVQDHSGKWINIYGKKTTRAGQRLPNTPSYDTVEEAVKAARERSKSFDSQGHPKDGESDCHEDSCRSMK